VLGSGHARLSPFAHRGLAERIVAADGAIVSEFAPDVPPGKGTFPRRNRIVSGLADATVVVEAGIGSGALITARWALEQGRECFLAPGPIGGRTAVIVRPKNMDPEEIKRVIDGVMQDNKTSGSSRGSSRSRGSR